MIRIALLLSLFGVVICARIPGSGQQRMQSGGIERDIVSSLPGYNGSFKSKHHAGYVNVSEHKQMFYYFVQSEHNPEEDPVVLWLNGGPGCSSFDGFVYEMGPFKFEAAASKASGPSVTLSDNPYAWNKVANMIYLDSPVGVGLSFSSKPSHYVTGDAQTADDAQTFLRGFFKRYPEFQGNDFFISGESYAGIYVPNLARAVVEANDDGAEPHINLVGYLVGNGCTDEQVDADAIVPFASGKSLISRGQFEKLQKSCDGAYWNRTAGSECNMLCSEMQEQLSSLNLYDILQDCYHGPNPEEAAQVRQAHLKALKERPGQWPLLGSSSKVGPHLNWAHLGLNPPCTDARLADAWLNDPAVREAIHAAPAQYIGRWQLCSDKISYTREIRSTIPIHHKLTTKHGLRALIYSGDHDLCVPHTGSERWTSEMGYPVRVPWGPWYDADQQVGGYSVEYSNSLTYATVKGAGHMVPETNPRESLAMFERFIGGQSLRKQG